ncbi:TCR/Tet family MFS transporter [Cryomorpha ignava]|uniref:TCR/Tet family MFS transporter n=1 Tax=Cryomorpha ignava TaxID=101383 RepID=A0A7K3WT06_9FLAO|nr:TCR/Tet family MFS transporter [Cryomorpha ignava]NEN24820.1 TCR/Tet family MFS transporter [Cryomorpha ignava]
MAKNHNASLGFIFVTVLIDVIGIGIIIPILPALIENLSGGGLSEASRIGGWLMFAYAAMQFMFAPFLGMLSDKYGRRPIILIALFGLGIDYIFHAYAPTLGWLFVGRVLAGISGASFTVATAYIADISTPEKKAQNFGLIGAAFGLGFIIGPVIGGVAAKWGVQVPFLVAAVLSLVNFIYGLIILPESLKPENRISNFNWRKANPVGGLKNLRQFPAVMGFIIPFFLIYIAGYAVQSTWTFFTMYQFSWTETTVGLSLAAVGVVVAVVQGGLIRIVVRKLGETKTIILGMCFWTLGLFLFSVATEPWMMFAFIVPYCLGGVAGPTLQGIISNFVPNNMQGQLQGTLTSIMSLTAIIGPPVMTYIFYLFTGDNAIIDFPGAPFAAGAIIMLLSIFMTAFQLKKMNADRN